MRISVLTTLKENWNVKVVYDPNSKESISTTGLYKYIRHPNYLIVILEIAAISLFHGAYFSFLFLVRVILLFCIFEFDKKSPDFYKTLTTLHILLTKRFIPFVF